MFRLRSENVKDEKQSFSSFTFFLSCRNKNPFGFLFCYTRDMNTESIVLGGGCFWCLEALFESVPGVVSVISGYAGGDVKNPDYREVCIGTSGHAEVVRINYNPEIISLEKIFELFFLAHDPTTLNRQGADVGTQYRSIILYENPEQMILGNQIIASLDDSQAFENPLVTEVVPLEHFYEAEDYHQDYFKNNPEQAYCQIVIAPKLEKFNHVFKKSN